MGVSRRRLRFRESRAPVQSTSDVVLQYRLKILIHCTWCAILQTAAEGG
jgi:hypothetical protein